MNSTRTSNARRNKKRAAAPPHHVPAGIVARRLARLDGDDGDLARRLFAALAKSRTPLPVRAPLVQLAAEILESIGAAVVVVGPKGMRASLAHGDRPGRRANR